MVSPTRDSIQSYMSITGASESLAIQRLEEHGNNLPEAINGHFRDVERSIYDDSSLDNRPDYNVVEGNNHVRGSESRPVNESRPVPGALPSILSAARAFRPSLLLDPNYRRNLFRQLSGSALSGSPSPSSQTGEITGFPAHSTWGNDQARPPGLGQVGDGYARHSPTYGSQVHGGTHMDGESPVYSNDAEEEMIRAAIEASKKDFQEGRHNTRYSLDNDPSSVLSPIEVINREDEDIARAISMSLEMEEHESAFRDQLAEFTPQSVEHHDPCQSNTNESSRYQPGSSSVQDTREDMKQKQPINTSSQHRHDHQNVEASYPEEWGGIPSKELQEAIMLEKALFSGVAKENTSYNNQPGIHKESQSPDKKVVEEESERSSTTMKPVLPIEPSAENEDAITLLVRMPDSSRHGRRFLKSDKLKYLFDFIDAAGLVKPGTYRVVRPYPRRAFSLQDGALTFEELSLTNKQEALFLELLV
ncbi:PREDICTED: plant UBX domain-containing protein 9 [Camelina sativa]|uniref:Plant UBX domain-containing protein 9 n=1 Tax=Camelina sativa TaxID=90675 RepID=A0ABM0T1S4_CAMSA|nr:PREDICTED: plant UBX domain-containing protein 9 [Camelina sativa]